MKKILIYSHDTYGLGNIRRMLTIANYMAENDADVSVLILSGSPMLHAFRIPDRVDYIKIPCLRRDDRGQYEVRHLTLDMNATVRMRSEIITAAVENFQPDVFLVDKKPLGIANELAPVLERMSETVPGCASVLLLRDILDSPEVTQALWQKNHYHQAIEAHYDMVLVVGSREIYDVAYEYDFPPAVAAKVRYCGYLHRTPGRSHRESLRRALGVDNYKMVLVTPGGGEDGFALVENYLKGIQDLKPEDGIRSVVIHGPQMSASHQERIKKLAANRPDVTLLAYTDDMMSYMDAADLVVCMGGYNTLCEVFSLRKRCIVVPRVSPVKEQWIRARRMADLGAFRTIHPNRMNPAGMMKAVKEELSRDNVASMQPYRIDMQGLPRIARMLSSLAGESAPRVEEEMRHACAAR